MMSKVLDISDSESLSDGEGDNGLVTRITSRPIGENGASSSGTNMRSSFIGMGFSPSLIDKVIQEKGEEDADLLLDTLFAYSAQEKLNSDGSDSLGPMLDENKRVLECETGTHLDKSLQGTKSMSSDSLDGLLDDDKDVEASASENFNLKQEPDLVEDPDDNKRASLLMMNFPVAEVDFAITKLGKSAPIDELVDFIMAAQIAESEKCDNRPNGHLDRKEDCTTEGLFGTMNKTLQLLDMGFNEHEVSLAIEKLGSDVPILELANCICATQMGESYRPQAKNGPLSSKAKRSSSVNGSWYHIKGMPSHCDPIFNLKTEKFDEGFSSQRSSMNLGNMHVMPKEEYFDEPSSRDFRLNDIKGKRPKEEFEDAYNDTWKRPKVINIGNNTSQHRTTSSDKFGMPNLSKTSERSVDKALYEPPYFLYGNFVNLSADGWKKLSQFLYSIQPEFVNTQLFSALNRTEGYIHNLPIEDRFHIKPKSPMTLEEVVPHTKKWWPSWDSRKQLSGISSDINGAPPICHSLHKMLVKCKGSPSNDQQTKVLYYCRTMNLVWVGNQKLAPLEPEYLERILGYPINHTRNPDMSTVDRLESLKTCFQTDTLGYYLSALKPLFPGGITLLSVYGGIGGAEVTLHRLGIYLKAVVSVESSETRRKILRRWWQNTDQAGELVQIENVQKLTSNRLESLVNKIGAFDLVICQNPCTYPDIGSNPGSNEGASVDFTAYYEFVRVLQRVKSMSGRT